MRRGEDEIRKGKGATSTTPRGDKRLQLAATDDHKLTWNFVAVANTVGFNGGQIFSMRFLSRWLVKAGVG
jgi:hypothetical protein